MRNIVKLFSLLLIAAAFTQCKKSDGSSGSLASINGNWQTTVWGGSNDTADIAISSSAATGTMTYITPAAGVTTNFSAGDVIFGTIKPTSSTTYTMTGTYKYKDGSGTWQVGHASGTLTLQNSTTLLAHYSTDASTGITPPDYYWSKE
jgi:hypothetical protein